MKRTHHQPTPMSEVLSNKCMKVISALLSTVVLTAYGYRAQAQTLEWGSEVFSDLADSDGHALDNTFVFELGTFETGFVPDETNVNLWFENWLAFDRATFSPLNGYFTSTVNMQDDGTSDSPYLTSGAPSFEGLSAYLWVRNDDNPAPGSEWLLTRADSWVFPDAVPGCCANGVPTQWSISDLDGGDVPLWGSQGGVTGFGEKSATGPYELQTYTFVPEPSSVTLAGLAGCLLLRRRRGA